MITEQDLQEAIAECQGQRNPNSSTCIKLAAFLTIQKELFGKPEQRSEVPPPPSYSYAVEPAENTIDYDSGTDFSRAIEGKDPDTVWGIMDELMTALLTVYPRLYYSVMDELQG